MLSRVVWTMLALFAASPAAAAHRHRGARTSLVLKERGILSTDESAKLDVGKGANLDAAPLPLPPLATSPTFVEVHSARVEHDLMLFQPTLVGLPPPARAREAALFATPPVKKPVRFFAPSRSADELAVRRERDKLLLFRAPQPQGAAVGVGLAMFGATTLLSAHAPRPLRIIFDGPIHLGPAVFDGGGMGAGIAGRGF
jgi:hypothetical protein